MQTSDASGRSAMRKAGWRLIPLIALGYGAAYMDRVNIGFAQLQMNAELHFSNTVYGVGAGVFFLSYAACEIPSNMLLYRIGARRWLARIMLTWGLLAMAMSLVRTPWQFYTMRFLLGLAEAGFFPGILYYLTLWFPIDMRARVISRFYAALPLSATFMGAVAGLLFRLDGRWGLRGWQWMFIVEGIPSLVLSAVFWKLLPEKPTNAAWLNEGERAWIEARLAEEAVEGGHGNATGLGSALKDARVWLFGLSNLLFLGVNYGSTLVLPDMIRGLTGLPVAIVGYIISGMGLLGAAGMIGNAWHSDRYGRPYLHVIAPGLMEALCLCGVVLTGNPWLAVPLLAGMFFAHNALQGPLLALPGKFLKGAGAAAGFATINMIGILGGLTFPPMIGRLRDLSGDYRSGFLILSVTMVLGSGVILKLGAMAAQRRSANEARTGEARTIETNVSL